MTDLRRFIDAVSRLTETVEALPQHLYHGTDIPSVLGIILDDGLNVGLPDDGPEGVSLTSSFRIAKGFADDRQKAMHDDSYPQDYAHIPPGKCLGAILELDSAKLINSGHEVEPHVWEQHHGATSNEEDEYRVQGPVAPLSACLVAFYVRAVDLDWHSRLTAQDHPEWARAYARLKAHPRRRELPA
jgi:hypothetical protein